MHLVLSKGRSWRPKAQILRTVLSIVEEKPYLRIFPDFFCVLPKNMGRTKSCIIEYLDTFIITYKSYRKIFHCLMGYDVTFWMRSRDAKTSQPSRPGMKSLGSSMLGRHWNPLLFLNIFYKYIIYLYVYIDI